MNDPHTGPDLLSERQWALFLETYADRQRSITSNEELGERRFQGFVTVVSASGVALGLVAGRLDDAALHWTAAAIAILLVAFGSATTARVAQRDVTTSWIKEDLYRLRSFAAAGNEELKAALPHMRNSAPRIRPRPWYPHRGGLVDLLSILTSTFAALAVASAVTARLNVLIGLALAALAVPVTWLALIRMVRWIYAEGQVLDEGGPGPSETFRANVGVVVHDDADRVLVLERSDFPGSWQFPQGGIDPGEERHAAVFRELHEETGIGRADVKIERELGRWLCYELPQDARSAKTGLGQVQWWVLARTMRADVAPDVSTATAREFTRHEWVDWDLAISRVPDFKRSVYEELAREFRSPSSS